MPSEAPVRIGVAGVGEIGLMRAEHVQSAPGCELVALGSSDPARAAKAAEAANVDVDAVTYDDLLGREDVDAVLVTSGTLDHPRHVVSALKVGKHVLVEKPAALATDGSSSIRAASADRPDLVLQVGYMRRFDPVFGELRTRVEDGEIGTPLAVELVSREHFPPGPDEDVSAKGGLLLDIGVHDFDVACWLLADEPTRCFASGTSLRYPELGAKGDVDTALVVIEFRTGRRAHLHISRAGALGLEVSCDVYGAAGSLHASATPLGAGVTTFTAEDQARFPADYRERFGDAFRAELAAFVAACRGERLALPDLETDVRAVGIALAARRSLASGCAEPIDPAAG